MTLLSTVTDFVTDISVTKVVGLFAALLVAQLVKWFIDWRLLLRRYAHIKGDSNGPLGDLPALHKNIDRLYDWDAERYTHPDYGLT